MFLKLKDGSYIAAEAYGIDSWGSMSQTSIVKKRKYWYIETSYCVNPRDDFWETDYTRLDVIEELDYLPEGIVLKNQDEFDCLLEWERQASVIQSGVVEF